MVWKGVVYSESVCRGHAPWILPEDEERNLQQEKDVRMVKSMNSLLGRPYSENKGFPSRGNKSQETKEFSRVGA